MCVCQCCELKGHYYIIIINNQQLMSKKTLIHLTLLWRNQILTHHGADQCLHAWAIKSTPQVECAIA